MVNITLGQKIRQARKEKGLTQQDVVGDFITRNMLSKIENDVAKPSIKTVEYLAERLDKPVAYLLEDLVSSNIEIKSSAELAFEHSSYMIKNNEIDNCISYLEEVIHKGTFNTSDAFHGRILYNLCYSYRKKFSFKEFVDSVGETLEKSISILEKNKDYYYLTKAYFELAYIKLDDYKYASAEEYLRKGIEFFNKSYVEDIVTEIELHHNLGYAIYKQDKFLEALKELTFTIEISREKNYIHYSGHSNMVAANCYSKLNNLKEAIKHSKEAVFFFDFNDNHELKARNIKNLGHYHYRRQLYITAKEYFEKAFEYFVETNNYKKATSTRVELLKILVKEKKYSEAFEYSKNIDRTYMNNAEQAYFNSCLGKVYLSLNKVDDSREYLLLAEKLIVCEDDLRLKTEVYTNLAEMYSKRNDFENAYKYSSKSSALVRKMMEDNE